MLYALSEPRLSTDALARHTGPVAFFVNGGRHEFALTVHALGWPAIWILAEEPGCVCESIPRRRADRAGAYAHSRDGAGGCDRRAVAVSRPDDGLVRAGTDVAQRRIRAARCGAACSSRDRDGRGSAGSAAGGVRGLLAPDGPTRPKWRCGPVRLDRGAEHHRRRCRTSHCLRRLRRGTFCRATCGVDAASTKGVARTKNRRGRHRPR